MAPYHAVAPHHVPASFPIAQQQAAARPKSHDEDVWNPDVDFTAQAVEEEMIQPSMRIKPAAHDFFEFVVTKSTRVNDLNQFFDDVTNQM